MQHARLFAVVMLVASAAVLPAQQPAAPAQRQDTTHRAARPRHYAQRKAAATKRAPETQEQLRAQTRISEDSARAIALAKVKNGTVKSTELERERGRVVYSVDVQVPGKAGYEEVNVSALTGKILSRKHESAKAEQKEEAKEAKAEAKGEAKEAKRETKPESKEMKGMAKPKTPAKP